MTDRTVALLAWYDAEHRPFPWRASREPYPVLVSEIMSQQTQIARVVDRFDRFLDCFPTIEDLAAAPLADVLAEWSGLGYNRRAQNLHACALEVAESGWPRTAAHLQKLPGIGPYTAAALASICFGEPTPAIDTNLRRVLSRWNGEAMTDKEARAFATPLIDVERPGDWNQAVMELGGTVCHPRDPDCAACPVSAWCTDSSVYAPPPRQASFAGSSREARGGVLKILIAGPATLTELVERSGIDRSRVDDACGALVAEGLISQTGSRYGLGSG